MTIDLDAISEKWLNECGACDYGVGYPCTHPSEDYRPVMLNLVREVERLRTELERAQQNAERAMGVVYAAREATRRLTASVIASAHLLEVPYTNADGSPWSLKISPRINSLRAALGMRGPWPKPPPPCCDLHGRHCEPPSELCCWRCTESVHPDHGDGSYCSASDLSGTGGGDDGH